MQQVAEDAPARVLIVAGSDSSGGAGIQADIKTVTMLGGYAMTAVTAITAQNTVEVAEVEALEGWLIERQIEVTLSDIGADVVKTGLLPTRAAVKAVCKALGGARLPIVVDPVLVATTGGRLADGQVARALVEDLIPRAALVTPNMPEAAALTGIHVETVDDFGKVADVLLAFGAAAVLVKGGHLESERVQDLLRTADGEEYWFESERIETRSTHGTGCTLASAIACGIGEGLTLRHAVARAREYVLEALRRAPGFGQGRGPLGHTHPLSALRERAER
ncbi:MAG: bifunctional hydroxymethylpyrimidine kinase/phosphomethylpyrimidine kinase [Myxococcales bacterium]|nr:bifunctional hydroxymethylpyrimidine kinase/phosphomethylpyrimidine kinase [Myxococcales bacterium]